MKSLLVAAFVLLSVNGLRGESLYYVGAEDGNWSAANVWKTDSGDLVSWRDGATAVISNLEVNLDLDITIEGLVTYMNGRKEIRGTGSMKLGAGGITNTRTAGSESELNLCFSGGIHLTASQTWDCPVGKMICLDRGLPVTSEAGVILSVTGASSFRVNGYGKLSQADVILYSPGRLSVSGNSYSGLGAQLVLLDGAGTRTGFGADNAASCDARTIGQRLVLQNGANAYFLSSTFYALPELSVTATTNFVPSEVSGQFYMTNGISTISVDPSCELQISATVMEKGLPGGFVKTGAGTVAFSSQNHFTGGTQVDEGRAVYTRPDAPGKGLLTIAPGAEVVMDGAGTWTAPLAGAGVARKSGTGRIALSEEKSSFSGTIELTSGSLAATRAQLGSATVKISDGATFVIAEDLTYDENFAGIFVDGGRVWAGSGTTLTVPALSLPLSLTLGAEKEGTLLVNELLGSGFVYDAPGLCKILSLDQYSGEIVVSNGVLHLPALASLPAGVTIRTEATGVLQLNSGETLIAEKLAGTCNYCYADGDAFSVATGAEATSLQVLADESLNVTNLVGTGDFYKTGPGSLFLSHADVFTGRMIVLEGDLILTGSAGENVVIVSNGYFRATGSGTVLRNSFSVQGGVLQAEDGASLGSGSLSLASAGTVCLTNQGTCAWASIPLSKGRFLLSEGGNLGTTALLLTGSGHFQVRDGSGLANAALHLGGSQMTFLSSTVIPIPVKQTASVRINAEEGIQGVFGGLYTSTSGKCIPSGAGMVVFAGGGDFQNGCELFANNGGTAMIVSNDVAFSGYFGVEGTGKRLIVADGATVTAENSAGSKGLHIGTDGNTESTLEVRSGGALKIGRGFFSRFGVDENSHGNLIVNGGLFETTASSSDLTLSHSRGSTSKLVVTNGGILAMGKPIKVNNDGATALFDDATFRCLSKQSTEWWFGSKIPVSVEGKGLVWETGGFDGKVGGKSWSGAGDLTLTGGGSLFFFASSTGTGTIRAEGVDVLAEGTSVLGTGSVQLGPQMLTLKGSTVLPNRIDIEPTGSLCVEGTGSVYTVNGAFLRKTGAGTLRMNMVTPGMDLSVESGSVELSPLSGGTPASGAVIWVDAAKNVVKNSDQSVTQWNDVRWTSANTNCFYAKPERNRPIYRANRLNGLPTIDFGRQADPEKGRAGDNRMMAFRAYQENIRTVFWVIGSENGGGFLLGDSRVNGSARHFHRAPGPNTTYGSVASDPLWGNLGSQEPGYVVRGTTWLNGKQVDGQKTGLSGGFDLVAWQLSEADLSVGAPGACWFASCYNDSNGRLNGGQELAEVLIYTNRLSETELKQTVSYLAMKWFNGEGAFPVSLGDISLGDGASFHSSLSATVDSIRLLGTNSFVSGVASADAPFAVKEMSIAPGGEWNAANVENVSLTNLLFEQDAQFSVVMDETGTTAMFEVLGDLSFPASLNLLIDAPKGIAFTSRPVLRAAGVLSGNPIWQKMPGSSGTAQLLVDPDSKTVWLRNAAGSVLLIR